MARKPQPGGDRNAWGAVLNEYLDVSLNADGTIKPGGVVDAVTTQVETALSVQLVPAIADAVAADSTVAAAAAAAVDAEPRVSDLIASSERVDPGSTGPGPGYTIAQGIMGPVWRDGPVNADWYSEIRDSFNAAGPGGRVEFSKGVTYSTANPIELQNDQQIIGNEVLIQATGDAAFKSKNTATKVERVHIDGLRIYGNNNLGIGFDFTGMVDSHVTNFQLINWVDYGAKFGGTADSGGWSNTLSHGRIWASPASSQPDSACVSIGGVNSGSIPNGNNITVFDVRMQANTNHAVVINQGDGNRVIACDIGYAAADNGFPAVLLKGGSGTRGNSFLANRYEKAAGCVLIQDASNNLFIGEYYGTPLSAYTGYNVRIVAGTGNVIQPSEASAGAQAAWVQIGASGNIVTYRGVSYTRTGTDLVTQHRRASEANNRFQIDEGGRMMWGGGGALDVQLDRSAVDVLRLAFGDSLLIDGGQLRMTPKAAPASGVVGDMYMATGGKLMVCTVAGTPGTWVPVGSQT